MFYKNFINKINNKIINNNKIIKSNNLVQVFTESEKIMKNINKLEQAKIIKQLIFQQQYQKLKMIKIQKKWKNNN